MGFESYNEHTIDTGHEYSEKVDDNGWKHLNSQAQERGLNIVGLLSGLETNKTKRAIIEQALVSQGLAWNDLLNYENAPKATEALNKMVAYWDTPTEHGQKTEQDHREEAEKFVRLLKSEV